MGEQWHCENLSGGTFSVNENSPRSLDRLQVVRHRVMHIGADPLSLQVFPHGGAIATSKDGEVRDEAAGDAVLLRAADAGAG